MSRKFVTHAELDFIDSIDRELVQSVTGEEVTYYAISLEKSSVHSLYEEAIEKVWEPPVKINARILWDNTQSTTTKFGVDSKYPTEVYFHKNELDERNVSPKEGDFLEIGGVYSEITSATTPQIVFGQLNERLQVKCVCVPAREGQFTAGGRNSEGIDNSHPRNCECCSCEERRYKEWAETQH